ncbi:MAG TPA: hypothetical protein VN397_02500, partial [Candidatus Methylomirabilis sp.]|nr:hypothetical protein [Candidatus Methylomirabilis sp.]
MDLDLNLIARLAGEIGYDFVALAPHGNGTQLECTRRVPGRDLEDACVNFDAPFDTIEFRALKAFEAAGWDVRFSPKGVRAYKASVRTGEERATRRPMFQNLPTLPPPPDTRVPLGS